MCRFFDGHSIELQMTDMYHFSWIFGRTNTQKEEPFHKSNRSFLDMTSNAM